MAEKVPYVVWLRDCRSDSVSQVGAKNAGIGEMSNAGIPVPDGFAVTTRAYADVLDAGGIRESIDQALSEVRIQDPASAERASRAIRQLIESIPLPEELDMAMRSAYQVLSQEYDVPDIPVALRSSATAEDSPHASFAGQHETFLWVRGQDQVVSKCRACTSSVFTPRAICYRIKMGVSLASVSISVGVQNMVNAKVAGVLLTLNPANGDPSTALVEANWGLGRSVASGEVTPDLYLVDKVAFEIVKRVISSKTLEYIVQPSTGEVLSRSIPLERRDIPCLEDGEILRLVRLGRTIEAHYGTPQNIEWAVDRGAPSARNILILQSRPETAWSQGKRQPVTSRDAGILEHMIDTLNAGRRLS